MISKRHNKEQSQNILPTLADINDAVIACSIAAKLLARRDGKLPRTTNTEVFKLLVILCKQTPNRKSATLKPLTVDVSASKDIQLRARLSQQTVAAATYFSKQSVGPATQIVSRCNSFVNSAACDRILGSLKDESKIEIQVDGPINLNTIRVEVKRSLIRVR
jgi:hypothetical protein